MEKQSPTMVAIWVNGQEYQIADRSTVADLLKQLGTPRYVAVEVNGEVVPRRLQDTQQLKAGDVVELVTLVGGG
jgi:thiamine biosynthesis protein ThiS